MSENDPFQAEIARQIDQLTREIEALDRWGFLLEYGMVANLAGCAINLGSLLLHYPWWIGWIIQAPGLFCLAFGRWLARFTWIPQLKDNQ